MARTLVELAVEKLLDGRHVTPDEFLNPDRQEATGRAMPEKYEVKRVRTWASRQLCGDGMDRVTACLHPRADALQHVGSVAHAWRALLYT